MVLEGDTTVLTESGTEYLIIETRAENTLTKYLFALRQCERLIFNKNSRSLGAEPLHVALYLTHLTNNGYSSSLIISVRYAMKWVNQLYGFPDSTDNSLVENNMESAKRV